LISVVALEAASMKMPSSVLWLATCSMIAVLVLFSTLTPLPVLWFARLPISPVSVASATLIPLAGPVLVLRPPYNRSSSLGKAR